MTKKFFDMIGYDPAAVQGDELTDVFDTEKVVAARQEYEAAVASFGADQESQEQNAIEFFNPISQEGLDQLRNNPGGLLIPGVRLRKVNDYANQNFMSFLTVPIAIAEERARLGGSLFSNPFSSYDPSGKDLDAMIEKYKLDTELSGFERLLDAESPEDLEARAIVTQRRQQRLEQIAIDNQGVTGLVGMMGMSLLDPTLYLTGGAATGMLTARVLNSTTKTGAALRFATDGLTKGEKFKIGATGYLLGEAPIELANATQDEAFDPAMTLAFMALAPLVGGAFNTLGRDGVDGEALKAAIALDEAIAKGIVPENFKGTDAGAGGAAQSGAVPRTVDEDGIPGSPPRSSAWTFGTPLNFLARSADPITRLVAGRLSNNPWTGGSKGTTAFEAQRRIYNAQSVVIRDLRMAAKEYFGKGVTSPTTAQLDDFFTQVGQHLEGYSVSENPAVIRAADALRPKYADGLAYLQDPNYLPGREKPSSGPTAPAGSPPAPPAPKAPEEPEVAPEATPDAPEPVTTATPDAPEPVAPAPEPEPTVTPGRGKDYFGRKSFRTGPAKEPEVPSVTPEGATSQLPSDGPPSRTDLRRSLTDYATTAEALSEGNPAVADAVAQLRRYIDGASAGSEATFHKKYLDGLQRLTNALEDVDDDAADKLLASVIDDLDNGHGSKLRADVGDRTPAASRSGSAEDAGPSNASDATRLAKSAYDERAAKAKAYDAYLAAFEYKGKNRKPNMALGVAAGAAGASALSIAAAEFWFSDLDNDELTGLAAFSAVVGSLLGAAVTKGRQRHWDMNAPGVGIFLGPGAEGADRAALYKAENMERAGKDRDVIWKQTGWGRNPDGQWVFEGDEPMGGLIDDLIDMDLPLAKVLRGKRLFELEPRLRMVVVQTQATLRAVHDMKAQGVAEVYDTVRMELAVLPGLPPAERLRVLIHELNHIAQSIRGGKGAYTTDMDGIISAAKADEDVAYDAYIQATKRGAPQKEIDAAWEEVLNAQARQDRYYAYLSQGIEAESRLTEARIGMSRKERRNAPPWKQLDVPEEDLWTGTAAMRAFSIGSDIKTFRDDDWWNSNVTEGTFGPESELSGQRYWKNDQVHAWIEDVGDGEGSFNWDWNENIESGQLFEDNPNASPAQSARAFAFAQVALERTLKSGEFSVVTFEGLKKPKPGQDMSGHERVQEFLMGRADTTGYVATKGSWKLKLKGQETTRSSFAFIREGMDVEETWKGIRQGKVEIKEIAKAPKKEPQIAASRPAPDAEPSTPPKAPEAEDDYKGLEEWRNVAFDDGYQPRQFNQQGWRRVISSAEYRNNPTKLGNRFGDLFLRNDPQRFEELGQRLGISAQEAAWRTGRKYIATVADLMNGAGAKGPKANRINPADREAAKGIVREMLNKGDPFDDTSEEALELILDIVAPVRKASAESPRARPRMNFKLSKEFDEDIADIFEWNAEKLYVSYSRHISGYAGILRAGYRSVAELNNEIKQIRENAKFDAAGRQNRAEKEANLLEAMRDAILGVPPKEDLARPEWQFVVNQIRRLNFGNLMNNVGFLSLSEVAGALTRVNVVKMFKLFPEYQRYIKLARAGDPKAQENIFYMADVTMGHGSAQLRSRVGSVEDRASGEAPSLEDPQEGIKDGIDRFTRKQANAVARFSGMSPIQEWLRMTIVTAEAQDWVKAARSGKPPYEARRMAQMGIDAPMWQRISGELRKWGDINSPDTRRPVPNMDLEAWQDDEALNFFINAMDRNANRIVMEGDLGHTALMLRNKPAASLFFQFLNFPLNAFTKHLGFAAKTHDVRAAAEVLTMMMGGAAGYMARTMAQAGVQDTEEERKKILAERLTDAEIGKAMLYYSAHGSVIPNVLDLGLWLGEQGGVPNPIPGYEGETVKTLFNKTRASGVPGNPITGNPSISRVNQIPKSIGDMATGTPFSEQDVGGAIKALAPFGNHIAVTALLDRMLEFLPDEEDSIEAEVQQ